MSYLDKPTTPGELIHFGVKGMHWGVRRAQKTGSTGSTRKQGWGPKSWQDSKKPAPKKPAGQAFKGLNPMAVKDPVKAEQIRRTQKARDRTNAAKTDAGYKRALENETRVERQNKLERSARQPFSPKDSSREEAIVTRALNQGYERKVAPAMNQYVRNVPPYKQSSDPAVNAILNRALSQGLDRVEANAGQGFGAGLPGRNQQL